MNEAVLCLDCKNDDMTYGLGVFVFAYISQTYEKLSLAVMRQQQGQSSVWPHRTHGDHWASLPPPDVASDGPNLPESSVGGKIVRQNICTGEVSIPEAVEAEKSSLASCVTGKWRSQASIVKAREKTGRLKAGITLHYLSNVTYKILI